MDGKVTIGSCVRRRYRLSVPKRVINPRTNGVGKAVSKACKTRKLYFKDNLF